MYILLFLLWILLNGRVTLEIVILGLFISGFTYWVMCKFLEHNPKSDFRFIKNIFFILFYIVVLAVEIVKSSLQVMGFVFSKKIEIQPQIVFFKVPLKNDFLKTILANSITLTPGTITVSVDEDTFCIHALDYTLIEDMGNSRLYGLLKKMEDRMND